jgi:hypothetical protein
MTHSGRATATNQCPKADVTRTPGGGCQGADMIGLAALEIKNAII